MRPRNKIQCDKCTREISVSNYSKHFLVCNGKQELLHRTRDTDGNLVCNFCEKISSNDNAWRNHHRTCRLNPERNYINGMIGKQGSNQFIKSAELGLPKVKISHETRKKLSAAGKLRKMDDATKTKISNAMKVAHSEHRAGRLNPVKKYKIVNKPCRLYVISAVIHGSKFIKIGITEKTVEQRFRGVLDNIEIIREIYLDNGLFIAQMENYLIRYFIQNSMRIKIEKFSGHTECFEIGILDEIDAKVNSYLFFNQ